MNDNILPIFTNLCNKNSLLNEMDFHNFLYTAIELNDLTDYCNNITSKSGEFSMEFIPYEKKLNINYEDTLLTAKFFIYNYFKNKNILNIRLINFFLIKMLLHEYFHIVQEKYIYFFKFTNINEANHLLLYISDKIQSLDYNFYDLNHDIFFTEYHSNINAFYTLIKLLEKANIEQDENLKILNLYVLNFIKNVYTNKIYPLKSFYNLIMKSKNRFFDETYLKILNDLMNILSYENDIDNILWGRKIEISTIKRINNLKLKKENTTNIFDAIFSN